MIITNAQYIKDLITEAVVNIKATIDGTEMFVPLDPANRHYAEILKQVQEGTLTIQATL
jgi:hypothetical protein